MPIPPSPVLRAAVRWLEHLPTSQLARTRALFRSHREFGDISPTQYEAAYAWLQKNKLLSAYPSTGDPRTTVFSAAIRDTLWFTDADVLVTTPTALPEDALRAAEAISLSLDEAFASVRHVWSRVNTAERARIGKAGELAIIQLLSNIPDVTFQHVAELSDGYGYDVSTTAMNATLHLEVKSTSRRGQLRIYLSRNEYETMRRDPVWTLVAVRLSQKLMPVAITTVRRSWVSEAVPVDRQAAGRWESVRLDVPSDALTPGLEGLPRSLPAPLPPILRGEPPWPG